MSIHVIDRQSDTLVIHFASLVGKTELYRTFETLGYSVFYIIDEEKSWFTKGGFSDHSLFIQSMKTMMAGIKHQRVLMTGISMGGYGAIRFAQYINPDRIIAFSPQIDLTIGKVAKFKDKIDQQVLGIPNLVEHIKQNTPDFNIPTEIHIGETEGVTGRGWADRIHADKFCEGFPFTKLIVHEGVHSHNIFVHAKKTNILCDLFK